MSEFVEIPISKRSLSQRKLILGAGINDAPYKTNIVVNGKKIECPCYSRWINMLQRCYSSYYQNINPTYVGCSVCVEWLSFSVFKEWMTKQKWRGMELDKDIISVGNKVYRPEACCFVSRGLNALLTNGENSGRKVKKGVRLNKKTGTYNARCRHNGKQIDLGSYHTEEEAYAAYVAFKSGLIIEQANLQTDIRIKNGLLLHAEKLLAS